jgi:CubicO group peptidase (beta-lactamase class C family)
MATISSDTHAALAKRIDEATANPDDIPGLAFCAVNKKGELIFKHASGVRGKGSDEPMTLDNVFWIASCTKMITGIACMQLVEQGKLDLDSVELCEKICPELKDVKVLTEKDGEYVLVEKERGINLRMLLSHTGMYLFFAKG